MNMSFLGHLRGWKLVKDCALWLHSWKTFIHELVGCCHWEN
jgi:hypothetical protein